MQQSYSACPPEGHPASCLSSSVVSSTRHFCPLPAMPYLCPTSPWYWYTISLLQALDVVLLCPLTIRCPKAELMGPGIHPVLPLSNHSVHANEEYKNAHRQTGERSKKQQRERCHCLLRNSIGRKTPPNKRFPASRLMRFEICEL